jgi:glucose/arabinose dehydrogenase
MTLSHIHIAAALTLAACSGPSPGSAQQTGATPFLSTPVASFDSPWALAFLPATQRALVTEKPGRVWLVDVATGSKQHVSGVR